MPSIPFARDETRWKSPPMCNLSYAMLEYGWEHEYGSCKWLLSASMIMGFGVCVISLLKWTENSTVLWYPCSERSDADRNPRTRLRICAMRGTRDLSHKYLRCYPARIKTQASSCGLENRIIFVLGFISRNSWIFGTQISDKMINFEGYSTFWAFNCRGF